MYETFNKTEVFAFSKEIFFDNRGYFSELYNQTKEPIFPLSIKQVSESASLPNVFRGFHFQFNPPMTKIIRAIAGDCIVLGLNLKTMETSIVELKASNDAATCTFTYAYIPRTHATAILNTGDSLLRIQYFHDQPRVDATAKTINPKSINIPGFAVDWDKVILSENDANGMTLEEWMKSTDFISFQNHGD